jgi:hypothetical protein
MPSSMSYPTSSPGHHHGTTTLSSSHGLTTTAMNALLSTATLPWHVFLKWLSWCCGIAVRSTTSLGAPPPRGYLPADKLKELTSIVNHMHTREDLYRRAIRELQEELDTKDSDRKKALKKLRSTKNEIEVLTERLTDLQAAYQASITDNINGGHHDQDADDDYQHTGAFSTSSPRIHSVGVHATMISAAGAVWFFSQTDHAALHWKLVFSMFFPLLWAYVSWTATGEKYSSRNNKHRIRREPPLLMLCASWFLIGFAVALSLGR